MCVCACVCVRDIIICYFFPIWLLLRTWFSRDRRAFASPNVQKSFPIKMTQGCVVKDTLASVASTMFLARAGHCISERDREVQEGKGSTVTIWVVPRSQETIPPHIASLQSLVNSCQGRLLKFGAASPQTDSINTHKNVWGTKLLSMSTVLFYWSVFFPRSETVSQDRLCELLARHNRGNT